MPVSSNARGARDASIECCERLASVAHSGRDQSRATLLSVPGQRQPETLNDPVRSRPHITNSGKEGPNPHRYRPSDRSLDRPLTRSGS